MNAPEPSGAAAAGRAGSPGPASPAVAPAPPPAADARTRLPREPYPGLRPFLDFEAALLFGRERQVREVIDRLRQTQFVAVLGGSGSGKSSLIHAGVVPELRSFGIPGAGDLWLPLTTTPGTNVAAADQAARRHSPITRLARRFAQLLKPLPTADAETARIAAIAEVFRQEAGFARLLDAYGRDLAVPPGPDPADARVLFVLDQFEEIFHPTNKDVADATLLVERVLDHFFDPHPHCHVVLTMRSEHLNDCAAFLELPDAINKSSYLIRRLDDDELRDAITGPAQRFLRLKSRSQSPEEAAARPLPAEVRFEAKVLERLQRDVRAITHDPDHLPLLQHLLARLWEAALEREEMDMPVPAFITEIDLVRAVAAGGMAPGDEKPLDERVNTLRACVDNWPESIWRWQDESKRAHIEALLRHLAFKDPNTGLYSQQRIDVAHSQRLVGLAPEQLRALLMEGFLGSVDYLFWDDEDPSRVTLKVSHESFIRGWQRFRLLIDKESERFDEYLGMVRKAAAWAAHEQGDDFLLGAGEMRRLSDSGFQPRLADAEQRETWRRFLQLDRDGARLARSEGHLDAFIATSDQRLRDSERREGRSRRNWLILGALTLVLLPSALFSMLIQGPVTERAELLFDAGNRANRAPLTPDYPGIGSAAPPLESLLRAAELIDTARTGRGGVMARVSESLLNSLSWIPPVQRQDAFLAGVAEQAEPPVNGKLRQLLSSALWTTAGRRGDDELVVQPTAIEVECRSGGVELGAPPLLQGRLVVAGGRSADNVQRRAIFVASFNPDTDSTLTLRGASWDMAKKACVYQQTVLAIPLYLDPYVVFDAGLRYFAFTQAGPSVETPSVTLQELDWERVEDMNTRVVQSQVRTVVTDAKAVAMVRRAAGGERVAVVESWRKSGGRALALPGQAWRIVSASAQRLAVAPDDKRFVRLQAAADGSACALLAQGWPAQPGFRTQMLEGAGACFGITRGNPPGEDAAGGGLREQVLVAAYDRPDHRALDRLKDNPPAPIASLPLFARVPRADGDWVVGTEGEFAGWLALRGKDLAGQQRLIGAPWSTCALWRLGRELLPAGSPGRDAVIEPGTCQDR